MAVMARPAPVPPERPDEDVLEELRERRTYATRAWKDRRDEGQKDVQCVAGEVWKALDPDGLRLRDSAGRPSISCDEIGQYLNQVGNDVRQNKRAIKATPIGLGATDQTAEFRENLFRQIEYRSNAARDVYSPIFEDALQRGYGFGRIKSAYVDPLSKNQELLIEAFPNPDVVTVDPDGAMLSQDCAKIEFAFIVDSWTKKKFKRQFGDTAKVVDFTDEHQRVAPDWIKGDSIQVAEYWTIERMRRRVVFLTADPAIGVFGDTLGPPPAESDIDDSRWEDVPTVCQYFTNGVELLAKKGAQKRTIWGGKSIPIFACLGKTLYVQTGVGTECRTLSMVRLAREPVMGLAYTQSCKVEILGSVPRATHIGYEGQFRGHETEWEKANHEPVPYLQVKPFTEVTGAQLLPLPVRQSWDPPLQNVDAAAESFRRSIQAAMGTSPMPTDAQRQNQKSGKALDRIESSGQKGSFHFVDHLDGMITRVGMLLDENLAWCYDAKRSVTVRDAKDQPHDTAINDPDDPQAVDATIGHHDITISVGPVQTDERAESSEFADSIVGNAALMQIVGPQKAAELTALAIRLKAVGPIGDEMAEVISPKPPDEGAPPTPEQMQQLQAQMQGMGQQLQEAQQFIQTEQAKHQASVQSAQVKADGDAAAGAADVELKWRIAQLEAETELEKVRLQEATKLQLAEYTLRGTQMQAELDAREQELGAQQQAETQAHEATEAAMGRDHEGAMATMGHAQSLEAGEQGADLAMRQAEHAQAIAPPEPAQAGA